MSIPALVPSPVRPAPASPARRRGRAALAGARWIIAAGAVAATLGLSACATAAQGSAASAASFAPGWEEHVHPLIFHGIAPEGSLTFWMVPATLPKGTYRVITRVNGQPRLVDGQRFTVTSDAYREVNLLISNFEHSPEAIDERWVILPGQPPAVR